MNGTSLAEGLIDVAAIIALAPLPIARFFPYTCSSGSAWCAGFHDHLTHRRVDGAVLLTTDDTKLAPVLCRGPQSAFEDSFQVVDGMAVALPPW